MPDIDFQKIELNLIPKKGDEPVIFYASQYESARPFIADLKWGNTEFAPGDDCYAEIDIRKNDNNLVVITEDVAIDNNEVSVVLPVQALTCIGKNLGQVKIYSADDHLIAALNFLLEVQPDPLAGGVDSETAIDNLTTQIESIAEEVIGENYYDKTEVDALLADKADVSDLPDMTQYYTKTQTDTLLDDKANISDLATVATTGDYDDLINKPTIPAAQIQSDYTQADTTAVDYIKNKPDINAMIAAAIDNILPIGTASGALASFNTALSKPLVSVTAEAGAATITRCGINLWNETEWEEGAYDPTTGEKVPNPAAWRSVDFIPVKPNDAIYLNGNIAPTGNEGRVFWYDADKNYIDVTASSWNEVVSTPANAYFVTFRIQNIVHTDSTQISINYPSTDTSYNSYAGQTVPVADATTLTTLSGVNNVYSDDGIVTVSYKDSIQHYIDTQ